MDDKIIKSTKGKDMFWLFPGPIMENQEAWALCVNPHSTCNSPNGSHKIFAPITGDEWQGSRMGGNSISVWSALHFIKVNKGRVASYIWTVCLAGVLNKKGIKVGVILVSLQGAHTPISVKLDIDVTNKVAKYEPYVTGIQATEDTGVKRLWTYVDTNLTINQILQKWKVRSKP